MSHCRPLDSWCLQSVGLKLKYGLKSGISGVFRYWSVLCVFVLCNKLGWPMKQFHFLTLALNNLLVMIEKLRKPKKRAARSM